MVFIEYILHILLHGIRSVRFKKQVLIIFKNFAVLFFDGISYSIL